MRLTSHRSNDADFEGMLRSPVHCWQPIAHFPDETIAAIVIATMITARMPSSLLVETSVAQWRAAEGSLEAVDIVVGIATHTDAATHLGGALP